VTVMTAPPSPLSSLVQTTRECGVTSMYLPKNSIGCSEAAWPNTKRYLPPVRTSASQERKDTPNDFGAHHRLSSSGLVHASNTMRAGPLKVRVTTSSRSDVRSTVVRFFMGVGSVFLLASIDLLLLFQNAASGGVRERGERGIEAGPAILNHIVQYVTHELAACKGRPNARCVVKTAADYLYRGRKTTLRTKVL